MNHGTYEEYSALAVALMRAGSQRVTAEERAAAQQSKARTGAEETRGGAQDTCREGAEASALLESEVREALAEHRLASCFSCQIVEHDITRASRPQDIQGLMESQREQEVAWERISHSSGEYAMASEAHRNAMEWLWITLALSVGLAMTISLILALAR